MVDNLAMHLPWTVTNWLWAKGSAPNDTSGNWLLNGYSVGAVHIYVVQPDGTAQLTSSLYSPSPTSSGYFGHKVALDGERLIVGAYREDSDNGSESGVTMFIRYPPMARPACLNG